MALSEPRSVRADSIPGSERHDTPLPRVSGAWGACRVDRGQERAITIRPSCGACEISRPRQPGPSTGHSAPPTSPRRRSIQQPHSSPIIPIIVPSFLLFRMGWHYRSRGACGQTVSPVRSGMTPTAARQRGVGGCRVDRGQERATSIRPSCGACGISRPRQPGPHTGT